MLTSVDIAREGMRRYLKEHHPLSVAELAREVGVVDQTLSRFIDKKSTSVPRGDNWKRISDWAFKQGIITTDNVRAAFDRAVESGQTAGPIALYRLGQIAGHVQAVRGMLANALQAQDEVLRTIEMASGEIAAVEPDAADDDGFVTPDDATGGAISSSESVVSAETKASPEGERRPRRKRA